MPGPISRPFRITAAAIITPGFVIILMRQQSEGALTIFNLSEKCRLELALEIEFGVQQW